MSQMFFGDALEIQEIEEGTADVCEGINIGANGTTFNLKACDDGCTALQVIVVAKSGTVTVTVEEGQTIDGATDSVTVTAGTGKHFFLHTATDWVSY